MNRRKFLQDIAVGFMILPSAGRIWKAVARNPLEDKIIPIIYKRRVIPWTVGDIYVDPPFIAKMEAKVIPEIRTAIRMSVERKIEDESNYIKNLRLRYDF